MSDIKVLHIVQTPLDSAGGPATYVRELSKHLSRRSVKVVIVSPKPSMFSEEIKAMSAEYGVDTYYIDLKCFESLLRAPWVFSVKAHKLISTIVRDYDIVNIHVESVFLQQIVGTFDSAKVISTIHGIYPYEDIEVLKNDHSNIYRLLHLMFISPQHYTTLRSLVSKSEIIMPVAKYLAEMVTHTYKFDNSKVVVIPNSVDTELFRPVRRDLALTFVNNVLNKISNRQAPEDANVILYVGRLDPVKGLHILLKSLTRITFKPWILMVVGNGPHSYVRHLENLARRLGLAEEIYFTGKVPHNLLPYFYSSAHIYVLPSLFEGLPATILEAMACGAPVVATRVSGVPEVIVNYRNGLMIDPLSDDQLSKTIEHMLLDLSLRRRLSQEALKTIREKFSWKTNVEKYITLCKNLF